ncbi:hypothetical protein SATRM34S_04423 [Streptomyces atroolivaceus]
MGVGLSRVERFGVDGQKPPGRPCEEAAGLGSEASGLLAWLPSLSGLTGRRTSRTWGESVLSPDRLAWADAVMYAPSGGEGVDEHQPSTVVLVEGGNDVRGQFGPGIGYLDTDDAPGVVMTDEQGEVPARYAPVQYGVRRELRDHDRDRVVVARPAWVPPLDELKRGKQPGEARSAPGGGEALKELACRGGRMGGGCWHGLSLEGRDAGRQARH